MRAIRIDAHGGPEALRLVEVPDPEPGPGRILVRVTHVGLNHLDVWVRRGVEGHAFPLPIIPGSDVVGIREDTGEVVALHPATSCGSCRRCLAGRHDLCRAFVIRGEGMDGGCCERVAVRTSEILPCPIDPVQAAALPLSLLTAWHMLVGRARVGVGDRVLVQSGAGGVGSLAIQVARLCGARVVATASTPEKRALCASLGAEAVWDHAEVVREAKAWSGGEGIDVVVDSGGAETWATSLRVLRRGGTYVTCGATGGHRVDLDLRALFFRQIALLGSTMGSRSEMVEAWRLAVDGRIRAVVDRVLPFDRIAEAHGLIEGRRVAGKVVLELSSP